MSRPLPPKPTVLEEKEVLQRVVRKKTELGVDAYVLKTDTEISGAMEVDIDAQQGDNIAIADATTGNKAGVVGNKLQVQDSNLINKIALKFGVDYDYFSMALSSGDTVETWTLKLGGSGGTTIKTYVFTYTDSTREVPVNGSAS